MIDTLEKPDAVSEQKPRDTGAPAPALPRPTRRRSFGRWLLQDSPYIIMLVLALLGVTLRVQLDYWAILTPVFGVMCIIAGWRHFETRREHLRLVISMLLIWGALIVALYMMYRNDVQGVLNTRATELGMMTLLALGTFVAGVQAQVWRICAVGAVLFLAVPGIGWLNQSVTLLVAVTLVIIAVGGVVWWVEQRPRKAIKPT